MWLCDECGTGGHGSFDHSRDALHEHMAEAAHFEGWISYGGTWEDEHTIYVRVICTEEGYFFRHGPYLDPRMHSN